MLERIAATLFAYANAAWGDKPAGERYAIPPVGAAVPADEAAPVGEAVQADEVGPVGEAVQADEDVPVGVGAVPVDAEPSRSEWGLRRSKQEP